MVGGPAVRPQRLALAARAVERKHELAPERLPQRVLGDQRLELGNHVARPPHRQVCADAQLERAQPELLKPRSLDRGE